MPTIERNGKDLLDLVKSMSPAEFDAFIESALSIRRPPQAAKLTSQETNLIKRINRGLSADLSKRYGQLVARRKRGCLSKEGRHELLQLTHEAESADADRAAALLELAKLRKVPVRTLMKQMGIRTPAIHGERYTSRPSFSARLTPRER